MKMYKILIKYMPQTQAKMRILSNTIKTLYSLKMFTINVIVVLLEWIEVDIQNRSSCFIYLFIFMITYDVYTLVSLVAWTSKIAFISIWPFSTWSKRNKVLVTSLFSLELFLIFTKPKLFDYSSFICLFVYFLLFLTLK